MQRTSNRKSDVEERPAIRVVHQVEHDGIERETDRQAEGDENPAVAGRALYACTNFSDIRRARDVFERRKRLFGAPVLEGNHRDQVRGQQHEERERPDKVTVGEEFAGEAEVGASQKKRVRAAT
jgi:hypothetical protein